MSRKALVVDDHGEMREFVSMLLQDRFEIVTACDGNDALNCLRRHGHIDLVITDFNMPGMDGASLILCIAEYKLSVSQIILMSSDLPSSATIAVLRDGLQGRSEFCIYTKDSEFFNALKKI